MSFNLIPAAKISASGLNAERYRMEITANNLANVHSTKGPNGEAFKKQMAVFSTVDGDGNGPAGELGGVKLEEIKDSTDPFKKVFNPGHPQADAAGMVEMPNISPIEEMLDMITATRAYEANLSVMKQSREIAEKTINILKV